MTLTVDMALCKLLLINDSRKKRKQFQKFFPPIDLNTVLQFVLYNGKGHCYMFKGYRLNLIGTCDWVNIYSGSFVCGQHVHHHYDMQ